MNGELKRARGGAPSPSQDAKILEWLQLRSDKVTLERFRDGDFRIDSNNKRHTKRLREAGLIEFICTTHEKRGFEITPLGYELLEMEIP